MPTWRLVFHLLTYSTCTTATELCRCFTQGFHVYSKVLGELTKRAPTIAAAPLAAKPPAIPAATETVFKVTAPSTAPGAAAITVASPTDSVDEVDDGWVCL